MAKMPPADESARYQPGQRVAVVSLMHPDRVYRIGRVVEDDGHTVTLEADTELENEAAVEHDLPTFEAAIIKVTDRRHLRPVVDRATH